MPIYTYHCDACDSTWEALLKIDERDLCVINPCVECGETGKVKLVMQPCNSISSMHMGSSLAQHADGAFKERLQQIKSYSPRNKITI